MKLFLYFGVTSCNTINFSVGDYYWNHYVNQGLSGYANKKLYEFLNVAQEECIELASMCSGITKEPSGYTLRRHLIFQLEQNTETWVKGQIWAANFVPRVEWGARDPIDLDNFPLPAEVGAIGHHTAMEPCFDLKQCVHEMQVIQNFHMDDRGWWDIGYNFLIGQDGRIYEGRGFTVQGAHCSGWNTKTLGIVDCHHNY